MLQLFLMITQQSLTKKRLATNLTSRYTITNTSNAAVTVTATDVFKEFCVEHAHKFSDASKTISGEQNLEYYELFQRYLKLYENTLSDYIESLDVSIEEFYEQCADVKNDPTITDKKLLHFVNYLLACTDYDSFYKIMVRAAKKQQTAESKTGESKTPDKGGKATDDDQDYKSHK